MCERACTWLPWSPLGGTPSSVASTSTFWTLGNPRSWLWWHACASSSPFSTHLSTPAPRGPRTLLDMERQLLTSPIAMGEGQDDSRAYLLSGLKVVGELELGAVGIEEVEGVVVATRDVLAEGD